MRLRDPFGMAVAGLRAALDQGLAPGQHLPVGDVAAALNLSTSPVREVLSRLCGEGLIEDRRGQGYFTRAAPLEDILGPGLITSRERRLQRGENQRVIIDEVNVHGPQSDRPLS